MKKQNNNKNIKETLRSSAYSSAWFSGFTLIEMMVVISIIALLSATVIAGYRSNGKQYALAQASQQVVSDLRWAQNMAMSGNKACSGTCYDYGVHFDQGSSSYIIFGDVQQNSYTFQNDPPDIIIATIKLPPNIKIQSVAPGSNLDIAFEPPNPKTYINKNSAGPALIVLQYSSDASLTRTITVTIAGSISSN